MSYDELFERLEPITKAPDAGLWGRQMTLGPTPEFCLLTPLKPALPPGISGLERPLERVWPTMIEGLPQESMEF
jgi:hypothetical protein